MADEAFHEIQLNGKQLVFLFMAATVVAVVIFLCGVMVGRGVRTQRIEMAEAAATDTPEDPTAEVRSSGSTEPSPTPTSSEPSAPASQETLSYPDRLAGNAPAPESLRYSGASGAAGAPGASGAGTGTSAGSATGAGGAPSVRRERPAAAPRAPDAPIARAAPVAPREPSGSGFAVQVAAVSEQGEADTIAQRLATRGYRAYVMLPMNGAPRVFRVRVGKFKDRREAEQIAGRLEKEEQFKPWITR